ncbi:MAG: helix-turn-helix transcriptional regulator [Wolbachia sp.]|nr:helix-turn-helix transcriptional regulator [Wolbachia sp.]MDD9336263.1 helix-turn-helix transcriptional regulator [Wolbachia sp.]
MEIMSLNSLNSVEVKKKLLDIMKNLIEEKGWKQAYAAEKLGIDQPKVSQIKNGKIDGFSLERLLVFLKKLGYDVTIIITENQTIKSEAEKLKYEVES